MADSGIRQRFIPAKASADSRLATGRDFRQRRPIATHPSKSKRRPSEENRRSFGDTETRGRGDGGKKDRPLPGRADPPKRDRRRARSHSTLARNRPRKGKWGSGARGVGKERGRRSRAGSTQRTMWNTQRVPECRMRNGRAKGSADPHAVADLYHLPGRRARLDPRLRSSGTSSSGGGVRL
jgi:hypothetical protein